MTSESSEGDATGDRVPEELDTWIHRRVDGLDAEFAGSLARPRDRVVQRARDLDRAAGADHGHVTGAPGLLVGDATVGGDRGHGAGERS